MTRTLLFFALTSFFFVGHAQDTETGRKGQLYFSLGPEYRITPIYDVAIPLSEEASFTNIDKQNSGMALNLELEYFVSKKLSVGFINSFRYDLVLLDAREITGDFGVEGADYKLLMGYHLYLAYYFKVFGKGEFFAQAGLSLLNRNSDFIVKELFRNETGALVGTAIYDSDYNFFANKLSLGYVKGRSKLSLGIYVTHRAPHFGPTTSFMVPHIGLSYNIGKL
ncbi:hypothetical protein [Spongiimicrobium sp. 2-473A-2-J]|uniref:hypothetical protein n=1 Tax=Eudoraea algarum TaxID=3417568 RepID=UPI003D360FBA